METTTEEGELQQRVVKNNKVILAILVAESLFIVRLFQYRRKGRVKSGEGKKKGRPLLDREGRWSWNVWNGNSGAGKMYDTWQLCLIYRVIIHVWNRFELTLENFWSKCAFADWHLFITLVAFNTRVLGISYVPRTWNTHTI